MAGRKVFTSGEILTAADVNSFLMNQVVAVFADDDARATAIPSPSEGMVTYREDANRVEVFDGSVFGPIGSILDVYAEQMTTTQTFTGSGSDFQDLTGLSITLTPKSSSSQFWVYATFYGAVGQSQSETDIAAKVLRDATEVGLAQQRAFLNSSGGNFGSAFVFVLDSPATSTSVTYKLQGAQVATSNSRTIFVNRNASNSTLIANSFITIFEVAV